MAEVAIQAASTGTGSGSGTGGVPGGPVRPQPIGVFGLPAGMLLIPASPASPDSGDAGDTEAVRLALLDGRLPGRWPPSLRGHELAFTGQLAAALEAFSGTDPVTRYNRFVISPDGEHPAALRRDLGPELGVLVDLVCFMLGQHAEPPVPDERCTGELAALVLAAQATHAASTGDGPGAVALLDEAVRHALQSGARPLAGVLLGAAASTERDVTGPAPPVIDRLDRGLRLLDATELSVAKAELHLALALALQELAGENREPLVRAVSHYHCVLQLVTASQAPELFAAAHANLATAYLAMPMAQASDQLRRGVAVRSLRAALSVYRPDTHPRRWASAQLNLANALVYAPSRHHTDNLVEAVELYESVLAARDRDSDPLGRARVLANLGTALAHLGAFDQAKARLSEARLLFEEFAEIDAARTVRAALDEIARHSVLVQGAQTAQTENR